jgi:hypothetical protein
MSSAQPKDKRLSSEMRSAHIAKNAYLIEFKKPTDPRDMFGGRDAPLGLTTAPVFSGKDRQSAVDKYKTMERKGFRVTRDTGCLIPDDQYSTVQQGSTFKGHQRSFQYFAGWYPKASKEDIRNMFGWPSSLEISHLCHRRCCSRIDHLVVEEKWCNQKRNYCGFNGECDCGNAVKCLRRYQSGSIVDQPVLCSSKDQVTEVMAGAPEYHIAGIEKYDNRDKLARKRKQNSEKRARSTESHQYQTARKQARLGTVKEKEAEPGSDDEFE